MATTATSMPLRIDGADSLGEFKVRRRKMTMNWKKRCLRALIVAFLAAFLATQAGSSQSQSTNTAAVVRPDSPQTPGAEVADELPIGAGDLVEVSMYGTEDFHLVVRVSNSKSIVLPLIGAVEVVGLTPADAAAVIKGDLVRGNFYTDP